MFHLRRAIGLNGVSFYEYLIIHKTAYVAIKVVVIGFDFWHKNRSIHDDHYVQHENISTKGSKKYTNKVPTIIVAKVYLGFFPNIPSLLRLIITKIFLSSRI